MGKRRRRRRTLNTLSSCSIERFPERFGFIAFRYANDRRVYRSIVLLEVFDAFGDGGFAILQLRLFPDPNEQRVAIVEDEYVLRVKITAREFARFARLRVRIRKHENGPSDAGTQQKFDGGSVRIPRVLPA